jgi:hypothetical protein
VNGPDLALVIAAIGTSIASILASVGTLVVSLRNGRTLNEVKHNTDGLAQRNEGLAEDKGYHAGVTAEKKKHV